MITTLKVIIIIKIDLSQILILIFLTNSKTKIYFSFFYFIFFFHLNLNPKLTPLNLRRLNQLKKLKKSPSFDSVIIKRSQIPLISVLNLFDTSFPFPILIHTTAPSPVLFLLASYLVNELLPDSCMMRDEFKLRFLSLGKGCLEICFHGSGLDIVFFLLY
jgi:hypothetical protein